VKWLDVRIGGQRWGVYLVGERSKRLEGCKGQAFFDECRIYISNQVSDEARDELLLHELFHALFRVTGAAHTIDDEEKEEAIVRDVTPTMHRLLVDLGFRFPKGTAA
jgi:Zn-dependent peptidase ImmA (M78 family)